MTIFQHLVPQNIFGISSPASPVQGSFIVHDVAKAIYAQIGAPPAVPFMVGYIPATSDGQGGIAQLARGIDARVYTQRTTGFGAALSGTTLTVSYPNVPVFWNGSMQTLPSGSINATVSTGTYSLVVSYNWGLTFTQIIATSSYDLSQQYLELCRINVNTSSSTATVTNGPVNVKQLQTLVVNGPTNTSYSIPSSGAGGVMPW